MSPVAPELELRPVLAPFPAAGRPRAKFNPRERQLLFFALDIGLTALFVCPYLLGAGHASTALPLVATLGILGFMAAQVYEPRRRWSPWQVLFRTLLGIGFAAMVALLLAVVMPSGALPPSQVMAVLGVQWLAITGWRLVLFSSFAQCPARNVVVVGADDSGQDVAREIARHPDAGYLVLGFVDDERRGDVNGWPVLGPTSHLPHLSSRLQVDALAIRTMELPQKQVLIDCIEQGTSILTYPDVYEDLMARVPVSVIDASWFVYELRDSDKKLYVVTKRLLDVTVALVGLTATALLAPLLLAAIKLGGGPGPMLYSQTRIGYQGRPFQILKFRTMCQDAERAGAVWAAKNDDRVTPVGRFLRQTRLDELPQFWNVLRGEMSVVGPRPERPEFVSVLDQEIPFYRRRHMVPPGLTGWAQVMFPYGASVSDAFEKLQFDLFYIKHRSCYLDLKIMFKTFGVMLKKIGAR